jgi:hypothetical protein
MLKKPKINWQSGTTRLKDTHRQIELILYWQPIKMAQYVISYQKSGIKWLWLINSVKLFYIVSAYFFLGHSIFNAITPSFLRHTS